MADISLSKAVRSNLLSLQSTATQMAKTQDRLATGNKVNTALDNPINFFTASSLNSRAGDLNNLMDSMSNSIKTIEAANNGITSITKLVETAQSSVRQALSDAATQTKPQLSLAAVASTTDATAAGKTVKETALDKTVIGATATSSSAAGGANLLVSGTTRVNLAVGDTSYAITGIDATTTVRQFIDKVNASGVATANVDDTGKLTITSNDSKTMTLTQAPDTTTTPTVVTSLYKGNTGAGTANDAAGVASTGVSSEVRAKLSAQFDEIRSQIGKLAKDSGFNGINLLDGDKLQVLFNEKTGDAQAKMDIMGTKLDGESLGILASTNTSGGLTNFQSDGDLNKAVDSLKGSLTSLRTLSSDLGSKLSIVQTRQDFTKMTINTLQTGAANLTLADSNEEAANLLALQTRQSLSTTALSMASQADQNVLQLLR